MEMTAQQAAQALKALAQKEIPADAQARQEHIQQAQLYLALAQDAQGQAAAWLRQMLLQDRILHLNTAYYSGDAPALSDSQWDALYDELLALEKQSGISPPGSPTRRVGAQTSSAFPSVTHRERLWSMDKGQSIEALLDWDARVKKRLAEHQQLTHEELPPLRYSLEYKFDGLTLNLSYRGGKLVQAATRGDGLRGEGVLPQVRTIHSIPAQIPFAGDMDVQGECIMKLSVLQEYNQTADEPLKNARNAAAGALRNIDPSVTAERRLDAYFYNIGLLEGQELRDEGEMIAVIRQNGLPTQGILAEYESMAALVEDLQRYETQRDQLDFLIDGLVIKVWDMRTRQVLGHTDKFPRWAIAFKFAAEEAKTHLLDVIWQVGRTGKLTPSAVLEAVEIGGVTVQRATLNNMEDIERKQLALGVEVWLRRSNDVIPEVLGVVDEAQGGTPIKAPQYCPACGAELEKRGVHLFCPNSLSCQPQIVRRLVHYASRPAMDIESLAGKTVQTLHDAGMLNTIADLYRLDGQKMMELPGFGQKKADKLRDEIERSKTRPLHQVLFALGIPGVGSRTAQDLAQNVTLLETAWQNMHEPGEQTEERMADIRQQLMAALEGMPDIGPIMAANIADFFTDARIVEQLDELLALGLAPTRQSRQQSGGAFDGKTVVLTGTLPNHSRTEAAAMIERAGGKVVGTVSAKTNYLLAGQSAGSKYAKAQKLGVEILDETTFLQMLADGQVADHA